MHNNGSVWIRNCAKNCSCNHLRCCAAGEEEQYKQTPQDVCLLFSLHCLASYIVALHCYEKRLRLHHKRKQGDVPLRPQFVPHSTPRIRAQVPHSSLSRCRSCRSRSLRRISKSCAPSAVCPIWLG